MNIGTISGGRAPNVIADSAKAEILVRLVGDPAPIRESFSAAVGDRVELKEILMIPADRISSRRRNSDAPVVAYTTDVPMFAGAWGEPLLAWPGQHSCGAHVGRTRRQARSPAGGRSLRRCRPAPGGHMLKGVNSVVFYHRCANQHAPRPALLPVALPGARPFDFKGRVFDFPVWRPSSHAETRPRHRSSGHAEIRLGAPLTHQVFAFCCHPERSEGSLFPAQNMNRTKGPITQ